MLELLRELKTRIDELEKKLERLVRIGEVVAVDPRRACVRVKFLDTDRTVSDFLPVLVRFAGKDKVYSMPQIGDRVLCIFLPNALELGFVIGQNYFLENPPPAKDDKLFVAKLEDGTYAEYNKRNSHFKFLLPDGNHLIYDGKWRFKGDIEVDGNVKVSKEIFDHSGKHGSLNLLRTTYNRHTHDCGSCTTSEPNEQVE